ncbi:hypothetical protein GCM10009682_22430 [Luedemannella flava]|uniref:DUF4190 domain-containing protein n=1 Tax=Luedemannella flava TaxID=349316 RepID=A0ABN2LVF6_9ACTN
MTYPGQPEPPGQPAWTDPTAPAYPADPAAALPPTTPNPAYAPPPPPAYGPPQPPYQVVPGYQPSPYGVPVAAAPTNGLAIASLITAILGFGFIAAIMGHIAKRQIAERGEQGDGFALAGIIVGWVTTAIWVLCCGGYALMVAGMFGTSFATSTY